MNKEVQKITSVEKPPKPKDPRKVEAGKRLAAISKEAKERKRLEHEKAAAQLKSNEDGLNCSTMLISYRLELR